MDKTFNPQNIERDIYQKWEDSGQFKPSGEGESYSIMIPPPNVTGSLHMGHAFQQTIMDALTRYKRMSGNNTLWQVGTDHAGIATQMVVERKLAAENGPTRKELGRDAFIDKIWEWKAESGNTITNQMRRLGASVDWERERFTMDKGLSNVVHSKADPPDVPLKKMKKAQLILECARLGLSTDGTIADLRARIQAEVHER